MPTDFQAIADGIAAMTCVVSVEKREEGYGAIRIVTGNRAYIDSIENPAPGAEMLTQKFVPNCEYTRYLTRDLNFEDFCYRAAVQKRCLHSYAHPDRLDIWFNMTFLPVEADDDGLCYCTYTMEMNFEPSSETLSSVSSELASHALEIAIRLRSSDKFEQAMGDVVTEIREFTGAPYGCILLTDTRQRSCRVLTESLAEGTMLKPMKTYIDDKFYDIVETWENTVAGSNCLIAKNSQDMEVVKERNPAWYESLVGAGVERIVLFPLKSHGELLGYIWVVNFNADDSAKIKGYLELATYILAAEVDNYLLLRNLKTLSSTDMLTGVLNRNEMNNRVDAIAEGRESIELPGGVVFADLNGLKVVNDEQGHPAGDQLLKDGAATLVEVFGAESVFRAGGDEYVVIMGGITEEGLREKVAAVREVSKRYGNVSFALGYCAFEKSEDLRLALHIADERMYADKDAHYGRNQARR